MKQESARRDPADTPMVGGDLERALVECARRLAAASPGYVGLGYEEARQSLRGFLEPNVIQSVVEDLVSALREIDRTRSARTVFAAPGKAALKAEEFLFVSLLACLQVGDLTEALGVLARMLRDTRVVRVLLPLKFAAMRLLLAGERIRPIGERAFCVITSDAAAGEPRRA